MPKERKDTECAKGSKYGISAFVSKAALAVLWAEPAKQHSVTSLKGSAGAQFLTGRDTAISKQYPEHRVN